MRASVAETRRQERKRTAVAFVVSIVIHLLLLLILTIIVALNPEVFFREKPPADDQPTEVTIIAPEEPRPEERGFVDSAQGEVTEKAPENAQFESDQNTAAASAAEPETGLPMPAVAGEDETGMDLRNQQFTLGPIREPSIPSPSAPAQQTQPAVEPQPEKAEKAEEETPEATPEATPETTPEATPPPDEMEIALLDPAPRKPVRRPEPEVLEPERPSQPSPPSLPGYRPETRATRLKGGISNRGRASVDAVATPLGRYRKMLSDAIGSRWYYYVNDMLDLVSIGTVEIRFIVRGDGKVEGVRVLKNSSNESLASCSVRSVIEAEIPPIPDEVAQTLEGGRLEIDYSFTIIGR